MKRTLIILALLLLPMGGALPFHGAVVLTIPQTMPINPFLRLWDATCIVESGNDSLAYNEREEAAGISQIRPIRLDDYNRRTNKAYTMEQMFSVAISREIYMYYASEAKTVDLEKIAKAWNGSGEKTIEYWNKIKMYL